MNLAFIPTPGPTELIIVLFVILLLFGGKKLPGLSRALGKSLSEFKKGKEEGEKALEEVKTDIDSDEKKDDSEKNEKSD
ncbi:hypothetical protein BVX94_02925 [bacterium B17]|nr:hypothetical protein BVX94_02925 [bacterium B17]